MKHQQNPIPVLLTIVLSTLFFIGCSKSGTKPTPKSTGPTITSLSVNTGPYTTSVIITGTGFNTVAANDQVFFNGVAATFTPASSTQLLTSVPLAAGTGNVTVTVNANTAKGPVFTYQPTEVVTTFAGSSQSGSSNGIGTAATFSEPNGIAVDAAGNLYVADGGNHMIRKITPAGLVSTFAGSGKPGSADGTGTSASFNSPAGVAIDGAGNIYVADYNNGLIRKITPAGQVSTIVDGTGKAINFTNIACLVVDGSGNLFVSGQGGSLIAKITPSGVMSTFSNVNNLEIYGMTLDKTGNIYVTDMSNNNVDKITPAGVYSVFAGNSTIIGGDVDGTGNHSSFYFPYGIAADATGNLYVTDRSNREIREITPAAVVTTIAGQDGINNVGPANTVGFALPLGITVDGSGNIYIIDGLEIRKMSFQ